MNKKNLSITQPEKIKLLVCFLSLLMLIGCGSQSESTMEIESEQKVETSSQILPPSAPQNPPPPPPSNYSQGATRGSPARQASGDMALLENVPGSAPQSNSADSTREPLSSNTEEYNR